MDMLKFLFRYANEALEIMQEKGEVPKGVNGPHGHKVTIARNSGHYAILFAFLYTKTGDEKFKRAATKLCEDITKLRPLGGSVWHRTQNFKTSYNGLIGQAWSIEALVYCGEALSEPRFLQDGRDIVDIHDFNEDLGLWHETDLDGSLRDINITLNQQIWFAAMALNASPTSQEMLKMGNTMLDKLDKYIIINNKGLLHIGIKSLSGRKIINFIENYRKHKIFTEREDACIGYHIFTLTGLAILYQHFPQHAFFNSKKFMDALFYSFSDDFYNKLLKSKFSFFYNVPGLELPFVYKTFENMLGLNAKNITTKIFKQQLETYELAQKVNKTENYKRDIETLLARLYETYRIQDFWGEA